MIEHRKAYIVQAASVSPHWVRKASLIHRGVYETSI